uniref:Uncharacterized protein n=1 Tax=Glossina brevipalpis TaxID=37001 RepID=A0A1A9W1N3_9MUSC
STVAKRLDLLWKFLKPVSFALIGKEINFAVLNAKVVGYGALLVLLGSLFRLIFAYVSTYGGNLTKKERAYITMSGFPKATVQVSFRSYVSTMAYCRHTEPLVTLLYAFSTRGSSVAKISRTSWYVFKYELFCAFMCAYVCVCVCVCAVIDVSVTFVTKSSCIAGLYVAFCWFT